jgi:hypothetical protein
MTEEIKGFRAAVKTMEARDGMRRALGDQYDAKMEPWRDLSAAALCVAWGTQREAP